jgi:hypothetical protein
MFAFDAWQLLGLTPRSSIDEARRAYYELARIVHPDRGGNAEDMRVLHEAYRWVYEQLVGSSLPITVEDPAHTPIIDSVIGMDRESLEACFDNVNTGTGSGTGDERSRVMALDWVKYLVERDLMMGKNLLNIEEYIQESIGIVQGAQGTMCHASVPDGYGSFMEPHEEIGDYKAITQEMKPVTTSFCKKLAVYNEPICPTSFDIMNESLHVPQSRDNYSGNKEKLCMTDYAIAHTHHVISNPELYKLEREQSANTDEKLEKALQEHLNISENTGKSYLKW